MRRAVLTVGLGFGDEGKGAAVDFLARARYRAGGAAAGRDRAGGLTGFGPTHEERRLGEVRFRVRRPGGEAGPLS